MNDAAEQLPDDLASALAALAKERVRRITAEAEAATAKAEAASAKALVSHSEALIARLKLEIEKVRRELYGSRSERKARLLEQMELQLEELEADAGQDELAAEIAAKASPHPRNSALESRDGRGCLIPASRGHSLITAR